MSSEIQSALKEQENAVPDAPVGAEEGREEPPRTIVAAISKLRIPKEERDKAATDEDTRHRQNLRQQRRLTGWTAAAFVAAALYAAIAAIQLSEMRRSTDAATSAACTAKKSLELTKQMFEASQAAVFVSVFELRTRPEHHPVWITVNMGNRGKTRATNVEGTITLVRKTVSGKVVQENQRTFFRSVIAADDGVTEAIGVSGTWDDLRRYLKEDFQVRVELVFNDGVQRTKQTFCKGPVMQNGTDTGSSFAFAFEDCENIKTRKQYGY